MPPCAAAKAPIIWAVQIAGAVGMINFLQVTERILPKRETILRTTAHLL
jgi:hypothetical protein